jgi:hypothetical protein
VSIIVQDGGPGFSDAALAAAFQPFNDSTTGRPVRALGWHRPERSPKRTVAAPRHGTFRPAARR